MAKISSAELDSYRRGWNAAERGACAELVRAMAKIERDVGATWEKEAREQAPLADEQHLKNCAAIGYAHQSFADRLEDLAKEIEARGKA